MPSKKNPIQLFQPLHFKHHLISENGDRKLAEESINEFFIHSFKDYNVPLKLPLPPHKKTVNDIVIITKGKMKRSIGLQTFFLKKNDCLFTPKGAITTTEWMSKNIEGYFCHFSDEYLARFSLLQNWHTHSNKNYFLHLSPLQIKILMPLLDRILKIYNSNESQLTHRQLIPFYLSALMAEIIFWLQDEIKMSQWSHPLLPAFFEWIHLHFKQRESIKDLAARLNTSPNHLNKIVKKETGKTVSELINELIVLEAKVLLAEPQMSIGQVSHNLGFDDQSYFSRFFKKHTGISPGAYRKKIDLS